MEFFFPANITEAISLLAERDGARCLAGGATLVAMMNAGLVEPFRLVSLRGLSELGGINVLSDSTVRLGAMTRHAETANSTLLKDGQRVLSAAAGKIANPPVRNMGTIGGSLAFADPAADYLPALMTLDAVIELAAQGSTRRLSIRDLIVDWYTTALEPQEIITAIEVPSAPRGSVGIFEKLERTAGDYAIASIACVLAFEKGICSTARIAVGACGPGPVRIRELEAKLEGTRAEPDAFLAMGESLAAECDPVDDVRATADYRRLVIPRLVAKAATHARAALGAQS